MGVSAFKKLSQIIALGALRSDFITALCKTESCFADISPSVTTRYLPMRQCQWRKINMGRAIMRTHVQSNEFDKDLRCGGRPCAKISRLQKTNYERFPSSPNSTFLNLPPKQGQCYHVIARKNVSNVEMVGCVMVLPMRILAKQRTSTSRRVSCMRMQRISIGGAARRKASSSSHALEKSPHILRSLQPALHFRCISIHWSITCKCFLALLCGPSLPSATQRFWQLPANLMSIRLVTSDFSKKNCDSASPTSNSCQSFSA